MSGTIRGVIECLSSEPDEYKDNSNVFKTFFDALDAHPNTTRIALGYGTGGTGTDYYDGVNPFGNDAFAVWRMNVSAGRTWPYYIFLMSPSAGGSTTSNSSGCQSNGGNFSTSSAYVVMSACIGLGGDLNPWNGTTNNDGTDTIPASLWKVPVGGTDYVPFPSSNRVNPSPGVDSATGKNCFTILETGAASATVRYHMVMDDDSIVCVADPGDTNTIQFVYIGIYEPVGHLTVNTPLVAYSEVIGSVDTSHSSNNSGVIGTDNFVRDLDIGWDGSLFTTALQPDEQAGAYVPQSVQILSDAEIGGRGFLGWADESMWTIGFNIPSQDTNLALTLVTFGPSTNIVKPIIPWDGVTTPGSGTLRTGTTF